MTDLTEGARREAFITWAKTPEARYTGGEDPEMVFKAGWDAAALLLTAPDGEVAGLRAVATGLVAFWKRLGNGQHEKLDDLVRMAEAALTKQPAAQEPAAPKTPDAATGGSQTEPGTNPYGTGEEAFAYACEIATEQKPDGTWTNWCRHVERAKPSRPEGSIRHVVPLYPRAFFEGEIGAIDRIDYLERQLAALSTTGGSVGDGGLREAMEPFLKARDRWADGRFRYCEEKDVSFLLKRVRALALAYETHVALSAKSPEIKAPVGEAWSVKELEGFLWIGPMRPCGTELSRIVYYRELKDHTVAHCDLARADAKLTVDAINAALAQPAPVGEDETGVREAERLYDEALDAFHNGTGTWGRVNDLKVALETARYRAPQPPKAETREQIADRFMTALPDLNREDALCAAENAFPECLRVLPPKAETPAGVGEEPDLDAISAEYERRYAAVPEAARRFASNTWGEVWSHAEMGSLLDFAALSTAPAARPGDEVSGFVLVPREPTEAMQVAGHKVRTQHVDRRGLYAGTDEIWSAMIAAAPSADGGRVDTPETIRAEITRLSERLLRMDGNTG